MSTLTSRQIEEQPTDHMLSAAICGIGSSVCYTAANVCLRAVAHCDPIWVSCLKAIPTLVFVLPIVLLRHAAGKKVMPSWQLFGLLLAAALTGQLLGNVSFQWSLGIVGMAMSVPLTLGTMIISGAVMGRLLLKEAVTLQMALASVVLIAAICVLSSGADDASSAVQDEMAGTGVELNVWVVAAGVSAACLSGLAYCCLSVAIRHCTNKGTDRYFILMLVSMVGMIALATVSLAVDGMEPWRQTSSRDIRIILLAGLCNAAAFWFLTRALELASVLFVNAINASQAAMAAVVGVIIFHEALTKALAMGVTLTVVGLLLMRRRK